MSHPVSDEPTRRRARRRVVRPAGTVGDVDESLLRSSFPSEPRAAVTPSPRRTETEGEDGAGEDTAGSGGTASAAGDSRPAVAEPRRRRAPDDEDTGWGRPVDDSNDDRLTRERPPHW